MNFTYTAKDEKGASIKGNIDAPDEHAAVMTLREYKLLPITIRKKREASFLQGIHLPFSARGNVVNFTRQLSTMIEAGLTLSEALVILKQQAKDQKMRGMIEGMIHDIDGGLSFDKALQKHSEWFSSIYVNLVRAGESAGVLDKILTRLADNLEKERDFRSKLKNAMIYPTIVILAMVGVMVVMMIFVVPRLTSLFSELGTDLPLPTKILIGISDFFLHGWYILVAGIVGVAFWYRWWGRQSGGRHTIDAIKLKLPIWGKIQKEIILAEVSRTLSLLISAGIPIIEALQTVAHAANNVLYRDALIHASRQVERGFSLAVPISRQVIFPQIFAQMIRTGESTGKLDVLLLKLSRYFESEASYSIRGLTTAIEPAIMIILGLGVAMLVMAVILPIYQLTTAF